MESDSENSSVGLSVGSSVGSSNKGAKKKKDKSKATIPKPLPSQVTTTSTTTTTTAPATSSNQASKQRIRPKAKRKKIIANDVSAPKAKPLKVRKRIVTTTSIQRKKMKKRRITGDAMGLVESSEEEDDDDDSSQGGGIHRKQGRKRISGKGPLDFLASSDGDSDSDSVSDASSISSRGGGKSAKKSGVRFLQDVPGSSRFIKQGNETDPSNLTNSGKPRKKSKKQEDIEKGRLTQRERDSRQTAAQRENQLMCPNCGAKDIEYDEKSGSAICISCGVVVEENAIVSSIEFSEAGGSSQVIGQFVAQSMSKPYSASGSRRGGRFGFSRDSRETTLTNGRRRIQDVASRLRLGTHHVDSAHRYFQIAVEKNFVQGRKTTHVVAACLYIACRQQKTQHMLIDFSDALQVNVYTLGTCFLKFRRLLGLKLEIIDPALYVYRFASYLELGEKANAVSLTALRIVARMKRDWIVAGRRPAGVCAASLLIASRAHGFARSQADVTKILRVCDVTVNNRIKEFELLPSAALTFEQFNTVDLESEANPPSFVKNRLSESRNAAIMDGDEKLLKDSVNPIAPKPRTNIGKTKVRRDMTQSMYDDLKKDLKSGDAEEDEDEDEEEKEENEDGQEIDASSTALVLRTQEITVNDGSGGTTMLRLPESAMPTERQALVAKLGNVVPYNPLTSSIPGSAEVGGKSYATNGGRIDMNKWMDDLPDEVVEEMDDLVRDEGEAKEKDKIFEELNADYLKKQKDKEEAKIQAEKEAEKKLEEMKKQEKSEEDYRKVASGNGGAKKEGAGVDAAKGAAKKKERKRKGIGTLDFQSVNLTDTADVQSAVQATMNTRKVSRKINYDAMSKLFKTRETFAIGDEGAQKPGVTKGAKAGGKKRGAGNKGGGNKGKGEGGLKKKYEDDESESEGDAGGREADSEDSDDSSDDEKGGFF